MNTVQFNKILNSRIKTIKKILGSKAKEYAPDSRNRFHNFIVASRVLNKTKEEALWGMAMKHIVSVIDLVQMTKTKTKPKLEIVNEKIGDTINYLILLEAMLKENK